jgi:hypothetical protein
MQSPIRLSSLSKNQVQDFHSFLNGRMPFQLYFDSALDQLNSQNMENTFYYPCYAENNVIGLVMLIKFDGIVIATFIDLIDEDTTVLILDFISKLGCNAELHLEEKISLTVTKL